MECPYHDTSKRGQLSADVLTSSPHHLTSSPHHLTSSAHHLTSSPHHLTSSPLPKRAFDEFQEFLDMLKTIIPLAIVGFMLYIPTVTTSMMCAHLNSTADQSASDLAINVSTYMGFSFILGLVTTLECLGSQAVGAGKNRHLGLITARTILICLLASCFITIAWFYSRGMLDIVTSSSGKELAGGMLRLYSLVLPVYCIDVAITRYAVILSYLVEMVCVRIAAVILHVALAYLFIYTCGLQLTGAILALLVAEITATVATVGVVKYYGALKDVTDNLNFKLFKGWGALFKQGIPGMVMFAAENIFMGVTLAILSKSNEEHYSVFVALLKYHKFYSHLYHSFAVAGTIITGNNLGKQDPSKTKRNAHLFCWFSLSSGFIFVLISLVFRYQVAYILSTNSTMRVLLEKEIPVYCVYLVVDSAQVGMSGVLRGLGKQGVGSAIYLVSLGGVGILCSLTLNKYMDSGGVAAWIALATGSAVALCAVWTYVSRCDWVTETGVVSERQGAGDRDCIEMKVIGRQQEMEELVNPFTNELFETVPLFNREPGSVQVDCEVKLTLSIFLASFAAMICSVIIYFWVF